MVFHRLIRRVLLGAALCAAVLAVAAGSAFAAAGDLVWANRYDGPGHAADSAKGIAVSPDGNTVFVTGGSAGVSSGQDFATEAINAMTGATVWKRRYNGSANGDDEAIGLVVSPDGSTVYVTGKSETPAHGFDFITSAYAASTGAVQWSSRFNGTGNGDDVPAGIALSPDGATLYVTGTSYGGPSRSDDYATLALNTTSGTRRWLAHYNDAADGDDHAVAIAVSPDGSRLFVSGASTRHANGLDWATIGYAAATGTQDWIAHRNGSGNGDDRPAGIALSHDGAKLFVTGTVTSLVKTGGSRDDALTVAYDASTGTADWASHFFDTSSAVGLAVRSDGDLLVLVHDTMDGVTWRMRYDPATGNVLSGSGGDAEYTAIAAYPTSSLFAVTGSNDAGTRYLTDGECIESQTESGCPWRNLYSGPSRGTNIGAAIAVSPDESKVYVTGESVRVSSGLDFATIAISA